MCWRRFRAGPTAAGCRRRWSSAWLLHAVLLVLDIGGLGSDGGGARLGFGPVLSLTVWLVLAVHTLESRLVPQPGVRRVLALLGAAAVLLAWALPGRAAAADRLALGAAALGAGRRLLWPVRRGGAACHACSMRPRRACASTPAARRAPSACRCCSWSG